MSLGVGYNVGQEGHQQAYPVGVQWETTSLSFIGKLSFSFHVHYLHLLLRVAPYIGLLSSNYRLYTALFTTSSVILTSELFQGATSKTILRGLSESKVHLVIPICACVMSVVF